METYPVLLLLLLSVSGVTFTSCEDFVFAVLSNPQAFRRPNGEGDPDNETVNGELWTTLNSNVVRALNSVSNLSFAIVNGDLTEFGRKNSWEKVLEVYKSSEFPFFFGLGDHDYELNVGKCSQKPWSSKNGCAMESLVQMTKLLKLYKKMKVVNFRKDNIYYKGKIRGFNSGSLSYSFDFKNVHFVQLQNYPIYTVNVTDGWLKLKNYFIKKSLTWLGDDLRIARFRNISDIVINFHRCQKFQEEAENHDTQYFKTIMMTYKPLVIFCGFPSSFAAEFKKKNFFADTKIYETGAAYEGKFFLVKYVKGSLTIEAINGYLGQLEKLDEYKVEAKIPNPLCMEEGAKIPDPKDLIFATTFVPVHSEEPKWWNLQHTLGSKKVIGAKSEVALYDWNPVDESLWWSFRANSQFKKPEFIEHFWIQNKGTQLVLATDRDGNVTTQTKDVHSTFQQWRILKRRGSQVMLINIHTGHFLHSSEDGIVTTNPGYNILNKNKIFIVNNASTQIEIKNVRYFQALTADSLLQPFPEDNEDDKSWKYLGTHDYLKPSPCIGW